MTQFVLKISLIFALLNILIIILFILYIYIYIYIYIYKSHTHIHTHTQNFNKIKLMQNYQITKINFVFLQFCLVKFQLYLIEACIY